MSNVTYVIVFKGEIIEGFKPISVKAHLAKLLKADVEKMATLFSGKQVVIKRTADKQQAAKYANALKNVGADIKVKIVKSEAPVEKAAAVKPAGKPAETATVAATTIDTSGISLAPNEGNIVEPEPEAPAPDLDLSGISVADNDGTPLVEPTVQETVEIDLSDYSVAEAGAGTLAEHNDAPVEKIEAPDFGLDEPGAMLETLQEEKELLSPNTMGMSLAMAGSDLLEEEEKEQKPPPKVPDTSSINLVPNFDL